MTINFVILFSKKKKKVPSSIQADSSIQFNCLIIKSYLTSQLLFFLKNIHKLKLLPPTKKKSKKNQQKFERVEKENQIENII